MKGLLIGILAICLVSVSSAWAGDTCVGQDSEATIKRDPQAQTQAQTDVEKKGEKAKTAK